MNDFTKEELVQILNFYKNKSIEFEFSFLALQIKNKKDLAEQEIELSKLVAIKEGQLRLNSENFEKEIEKLKKENEKLKNPNKVLKNNKK
jgi:uncharacterized membrane protein